MIRVMLLDDEKWQPESGGGICFEEPFM